MGAPATAAQRALVVTPTGPADGAVRLVVEVPEGAEPVRPEDVAVTVDGAPAPGATVQPVLSDRLALGLVVDASDDGAPMLPVGLGGAANLVLTAPPSTRGTVITDATPPAIAAPWPSAQPVLLRALSTVRPGGARSTPAALDLALAQLPAPLPTGDDPRLVVLYTSAPDAGGAPAAAVAGRMRAAGVVLAVVNPSTGAPSDVAESGFWADAAGATGGLAVGSGPADVIAAFDRAAAALGRRYVVTAPAPARLPATVAVRVGPLAGETALAAPPPDEPRPNRLVPVVAGAGLLGALTVLLVVVVRRIHRGAAPAAGPDPRPPQVRDVPPRVEDALDRDELITELEAALRGGRPVWVRPHPDEAGLGITTVLTEFAHRHRDRYDVAWWVPAMDPDLVADRMAELAEALDVAGPDDSADRAAAAVVEALAHRDRWLLVFDDAGGPRQLAGYLPDGPGDVVISSSHAGWRDLAGPVEVRGFTRAESVSLLRARRPDLDSGSAERLAAALRDLPVAVGPVAAFLADTGADPGLPDDPAEAWAAMLDRTQADDPPALALLTLVAWLGPAPVPLSLLNENSDLLPEPLDTVARLPAGLRDRAALLGRRGLARATADDVAVHPVVAELVVTRTRHDQPVEGGWTEVAVRVLRAAAPDGPATEPAVRAAWRRLLPHVLAATDPVRRLDPVAAEVGWLLRRAGEYVAARGRTHAAQALLDDARGFGAGGPTA